MSEHSLWCECLEQAKSDPRLRETFLEDAIDAKYRTSTTDIGTPLQDPDEVLTMYREFLKNLDPALSNAAPNELDHFGFPEKHSRLYKRTETFLTQFILYKEMHRTAEEKAKDIPVDFEIALTVKERLIYWIYQYYRLRELEKPQIELLELRLSGVLDGAIHSGWLSHPKAQSELSD